MVSGFLVYGSLLLVNIDGLVYVFFFTHECSGIRFQVRRFAIQAFGISVEC